MDNIKSRHVRDTENSRGMTPTPLNFEDFIPQIQEQNRIARENSSSNFNLNSGSSRGKNLGHYFDNDSQYDSQITESQILDGSRSLEDLRASRQPWYDQVTNNLLNMGVIATTTFADSFVGTVGGAINLAFTNPEMDKGVQGFVEERLDTFVANPVSLWLNSINKWTKEKFPTYNTDQAMLNREEGKWWKNMNTSQFWGETIMENAGFTLGMVASGKVSGNLLNKISKVNQEANIIKKGINNAIKEGKIAGNADDIFKKVLQGKQNLAPLNLDSQAATAIKNINKAGVINKNISTAIAVSGEARQEGINSSLAYKEEQMNRLDTQEAQQELLAKTIYQSFAENPEMFRGDPNQARDLAELLDSVNPESVEEIQKRVDENKKLAIEAIEDAGSRITGMSFALNFPVLYGSSLWQFGRAFAGGYSTQKGFLNNAKKALRADVNNNQLAGASRVVNQGGKYVVRNNIWDKIKTAGRVAGNPIAETNEEMLQSSIELASSRSAGHRMNTFLGYKFDPEAEAEQRSAISNVWNSILDTYSDPASWEEGFSGFFMGGMGSANITFSKNSQGRRPIFEGGVMQDVRDIRQENSELEAAVEALNNRMASEEFRNYYQGNIRHNAFEANKLDALEQDDKFAFLNNDHAQLISDIMMFERVGKLQDLHAKLDQDIENFSTTDKSKITEIAEEVRELSKNQETGKSPYETKEDHELVEDLLKNSQKMKKSLTDYSKTVNNLTTLIGNDFWQDNEFNEMVYLFTQIENLDNRYEEVYKSLLESFEKLNDSALNSTLFDINLDNTNKKLSFREILEQASPTELYEFLLGEIRREDSSYISDLLDINSKMGAASEVLKKGDMSAQEAFEAVRTLINGEEGVKERGQITSDLVDLTKLQQARFNLANLYNKFIQQPHYLTELISEDLEDAANEQDKNNNKEIIDRIKEATDIHSLKGILEKESETISPEHMEKILDTMRLSDNTDSYSPLVEEYLDRKDFIASVRKMGESKNIDPQIMEEAEALISFLEDNTDTLAEFTERKITTEEIDIIMKNSSEGIRQETLATLNDLIDSVKKETNIFNNIGSEKEAPVSKSPTVREEPAINDDPRIIFNENSNIKDNLEGQNNRYENAKDMWYPGVQEGPKWENNPSYRRPIDFLKKHGAFEFINNGGVKKGDKVYFYASTEYWDFLKEGRPDPEWVDNNKPLLQIVKSPEGTIDINGEKFQVVGVHSKVMNANLHESVVKDGFSEKHSTTVTNVTYGNINFNQEKSISSLQSTEQDLKGRVGDRLEFNQAIIDKLTEEGIIDYTDEKGNPCKPGGLKAEDGMTDTVTGSKWKIVKDFKGMPKHSQGGVDISISDKGVSMRRGGVDIKAAHGLLIAAKGLTGNIFENGGNLNTRASSEESPYVELQNMSERTRARHLRNYSRENEQSVIDNFRLNELREKMLENSIQNNPLMGEIVSKLPPAERGNFDERRRILEELALSPEYKSVYYNSPLDLGLTQEEADEYYSLKPNLAGQVTGNTSTRGTSNNPDALGIRELNLEYSNTFVKEYRDANGVPSEKIIYIYEKDPNSETGYSPVVDKSFINPNNSTVPEYLRREINPIETLE